MEAWKVRGLEDWLFAAYATLAQRLLRRPAGALLHLLYLLYLLYLLTRNVG